MALTKKKVNIVDPVEAEYASILTPYSLSFVSKQLALRRKVGIIQELDTKCHVSSSEGILKTTPVSCSCKFRTSLSTHLPCRHMFAARDRKQLSLFDADLVSYRWTLQYMKEVCFSKECSMDDDTFQVTTIGKDHTKTVLNQHQKFHQAQQVTQQLATLCSEVSMEEFKERLSLLNMLKDGWAKGIKVALSIPPINSSDPTLSSNDLQTSKVSNGDGDSVASTSSELQTTSNQSTDVHMEQESNDDITNKENGSNHPLADLSNISLPPKMRKRGRPKGANKTVIGLPRKKHRGDKPIPFIRKLPLEKERAILSWFVDADVAAAAIAGNIIDETEVEVRPEKVPASCLDENVCLESCRKYCSLDAWNLIKSVVDIIRNNPVYYCGRCTNPISEGTQSSIVCECCLTWFHFSCLNMKQPPKCKV